MIKREQTTITIIYTLEEVSTVLLELERYKAEGFTISDYFNASEEEKGYYRLFKQTKQ